MSGIESKFSSLALNSGSDHLLQQRRRFLARALGASAVAALPVSSWSQTAGAAKPFRLGYIGPGKKPAYATGWALQQGLLQKELAPLGFGEVVTRVFPNGPDLNEALVAGHLDVGVYGDTPAVVARAQGFEGKLLGFDSVGMNAWLLTPRGGVSSVKELEGKVVGVALGSYMHRFVLGTLKAAGIHKKVKIVHMLPRDGAPALERASVAAFAAPNNLGPLLAEKGFPVIDEAAKHPTLLGTSVIVASPKLLAALPQFPQAWGRARAVALQEIRRDEDRYFAFHAEVSGFPEATVRASMNLSSLPEQAYPQQGMDLLAEVQRFLLGEKLIRQDFKLTQWTV